MIRQAILREVVGPDPLGAISRPDLRPSLRGQFGILFRLTRLQDASRQDLHGLGLVLVLGTLCLAGRHDAGRQVGDADRGVRGVDVLPTCTARPVGVDPAVGLVDIDLEVLVEIGCDVDARKGRVTPSGRVEGGDPHQAVHPDLRLEVAIGVRPLDLDLGGLDASLVVVLQVASRFLRKYQPAYTAREAANLRGTRQYVQADLIELKTSLYKQYLDECSSDPSGMQL